MKKYILLLLTLFMLPATTAYAETETIEEIEQEIKILQDKLAELKADNSQPYAEYDKSAEPLAVVESSEFGFVTLRDQVYTFDSNKSNAFKSIAFVATVENNTSNVLYPSTSFFGTFEMYQTDDDGNRIKLDYSMRPSFIHSNDSRVLEAELKPGETVDIEYYLTLISETSPVEIYHYGTDELIASIELADLTHKE